MMNKAEKKEKKQNGIVKYFKGIKSELKKIVWPTWKQVIKNTLIVLLVVAIFAVIISGLDLLFNVSLIKWITK